MSTHNRFSDHEAMVQLLTAAGVGHLLMTEHANRGETSNRGDHDGEPMGSGYSATEAAIAALSNTDTRDK